MKLTQIKKEIERLPESKKELALALYEKCVFQDAELTELQKIIKKNGWTEGYQNGANQSGRKKTAEADAYLSLSKVFNTTVKQLNDIVSASAEAKETNAVLSYIGATQRR